MPCRTTGGWGMHTWRFALAALAALCLSACLPVTTSWPVGSSIVPVDDMRIEGTWSGKIASDPSGATYYFHIVANDTDNGFTMVGMKQIQGDAAASWVTYKLNTARLKSHYYFNARLVSINGVAATADKAKLNIPLLYELNGDSLTISVLDETKAATAIHKKEIEGSVIRGQFGSDVVITGAGKRLDPFLGTAEGALMFTKFMELKRSKTASSTPAHENPRRRPRSGHDRPAD